MNNFNFFSGIAFFTTFLITTNLEAQMYDHAIGLRGGAGINFTYKKFFDGNNAFEAIVGWYTGRDDHLGLGLLYERHEEISELHPLHWYWAAGGFVTLVNSTGIGLMGGAGLDISFNRLPINISIDLLPRIQIAGSNRFIEFGGGLAVRYILN